MEGHYKDDWDGFVRVEGGHTKNVVKIINLRAKILRILKWTPPIQMFEKPVITYYAGEYTYGAFIHLVEWPLEASCLWCSELSFLLGEEFEFQPTPGSYTFYYRFKESNLIVVNTTSKCSWEGDYLEEQVKVLQEKIDRRRLVCS